MSLTSQEVKSEARRWGARIVGIGSVDRWMNAPRGHGPKDFLPKAKAVVVFGLPQFKAMAQWRNFMKGSEMYPEARVEGLPNRLMAAHQIYDRMQYDGINLYLQTIATMLGCFLTDAGHDVVTFPPSGGSGISGTNMVPEMYRFGFHQWSHRHAAVACGLGELGMNSGFICPEYGLRTRLCSLITDAPLDSDPLLKTGDVCLGEDCDLCVKTCPEPKPHGDIYSYELIPGYEIVTREMNFRDCAGSFCARCMAVCPVGR